MTTMEDLLNNNREEIVDNSEEERETPILDFDLNEEVEYEIDLNKFSKEWKKS